MAASALGTSPTAIYRGPFGEEQALRLLWRAGFGPKPGDVERYAKLGMEAAVASLTRPQGATQLIGAPPHDDKGRPLDPIDVWGDDHCWWLDRMVRSNRPLIERMTLIWHSWFATSEEASNARLMINQNWTFRRNALGNFRELLSDVTVDPAMLLWLNGNTNNKYSPNENYGREMLELFTLGQGRGYNQEDVHQNARALTGWTNDWSETRGPVNFRFEATLHDYGVKKVFGHVGRWDWKDSVRFAVAHPTHPSFFVSKLWGYFVGAELPNRTARELEDAYVRGGYEIRPIVEAILRHPLFYEGPAAGLATDRLDRRAAAREQADDHEHRLGVDRQPDGAGAVPAAERRRLGLRAVAGHLALGRPAAGREHGARQQARDAGQDLPLRDPREQRAGLQQRDRVLGRTTLV